MKKGTRKRQKFIGIVKDDREIILLSRESIVFLNKSKSNRIDGYSQTS